MNSMNEQILSQVGPVWEKLGVSIDLSMKSPWNFLSAGFAPILFYDGDTYSNKKHVLVKKKR